MREGTAAHHQFVQSSNHSKWAFRKENPIKNTGAERKLGSREERADWAVQFDFLSMKTGKDRCFPKITFKK